jgi:hypothetical protein
MAIIITKAGKNAVKVEKSGFAQEDYLQKYICDNPDSIPLYDIQQDIRLLIVAREFLTQTGSIDALGVDQDGEIYVIETKLYKNPDKRLVVAQVLDYGASLWGTSRDPDQFFDQIDSVKKLGTGGFDQRVKDFFELEDSQTAELRAAVKKNLADGKFRFVVLMDKLHQELKKLILFINRSSKFQLFAVEMEYYKHEDSEIVIPKLFGAEVISEPASRPTTSQLLDEADRRKVSELVDICRSLRGDACNERPESTLKGSFRYYAKRKDGGVNIVFGINVAGHMFYIDPPLRGELDVWLRPETIAQVTGIPEDTIRATLEHEHGAFKNKDLGHVIRLKSPEAAKRLVTQLKTWIK